MKTKIIIIITAAVILILTTAIGLIYWRWAHVPGKKVVIPKRAVIKETIKKSILPSIQKKHPHPKVVIVMDDFGYNMNDLEELFAAKSPITFSILPNLPYSRRLAELASSKGYEVILHLPLEANDKSAPLEAGTIKTGMDEKEVIAILEKNIENITGLRGTSNHQGSKATENKALMTIILKDLKKRNLFFFDSLVTQKSICRDVAAALGVPYAKRDMFLDNTNSADYIERQALALRKFAFKNGRAIAICHDRKNTIAVLSKMMPELAADGIVFVRLSDMVK